MLLQDRFHDYDLCFLSWWYMKSFHILIFSFRILHLGLLFVKLCYNNNNITLLYDMTIWYMTLFACFTRDDFSCELTELRSSMKSQLQSAQNKSETRWGSFGAQLVVSDMRRIGWIGCFDTIPAQIAPACVRLNAAGQVRREANLPYQGQFQLKKKAWKKNMAHIMSHDVFLSPLYMRKVWTTKYEDTTHDSRNNLAGDCPVAMIKVVLWTCNNESCQLVDLRVVVVSG